MHQTSTVQAAVSVNSSCCPNTIMKEFNLNWADLKEGGNQAQIKLLPRK